MATIKPGEIIGSSTVSHRMKKRRIKAISDALERGASFFRVCNNKARQYNGYNPDDQERLGHEIIERDLEIWYLNSSEGVFTCETEIQKIRREKDGYLNNLEREIKNAATNLRITPLWHPKTRWRISPEGIIIRPQEIWIGRGEELEICSARRRKLYFDEENVNGGGQYSRKFWTKGYKGIGIVEFELTVEYNVPSIGRSGPPKGDLILRKEDRILNFNFTTDDEYNFNKVFSYDFFNGEPVDVWKVTVPRFSLEEAKSDPLILLGLENLLDFNTEILERFKD